MMIAIPAMMPHNSTEIPAVIIMPVPGGNVLAARTRTGVKLSKGCDLIPMLLSKRRFIVMPDTIFQNYNEQRKDLFIGSSLFARLHLLQRSDTAPFVKGSRRRDQ